jgi:hypothetical protein
MPLRLLDSLSLPGDPAKPNEDSFGHDTMAALVMDGATPLGEPLMPGPSDAAWIVQFGARRILAHLKDGDAPLDAVRHALTDTEKSFAALRRHPIREKWQTPCSSMMIAVETSPGPPPPRARSALEGEAAVAPSRCEGRRGLEFLWFGDCAALIAEGESVVLIGETIAKRGQEAARAKSWAGIGPLTGPNRSAEMLARHRAGRNHINSGRHWLFTPDIRAADHVSRTTRKLTPGAHILLASDGFLALVSDYRAYDPAGLMDAAKQKGLAVLGAELRAVEEADSGGEQFPRFKKSDDATALLIEVS